MLLFKKIELVVLVGPTAPLNSLFSRCWPELNDSEEAGFDLLFLFWSAVIHLCTQEETEPVVRGLLPYTVSKFLE